MTGRKSGPVPARAMLACLLLVSACSPGDHAQVGTLTAQKIAARVAEQHLYRHLSVAPRTLDPLMNQDVPGTTIAQDLFEGLLQDQSGWRRGGRRRRALGIFQ